MHIDKHSGLTFVNASSPKNNKSVASPERDANYQTATNGMPNQNSTANYESFLQACVPANQIVLKDGELMLPYQASQDVQVRSLSFAQECLTQPRKNVTTLHSNIRSELETIWGVTDLLFKAGLVEFPPTKNNKINATQLLFYTDPINDSAFMQKLNNGNCCIGDIIMSIDDLNSAFITSKDEELDDDEIEAIRKHDFASKLIDDEVPTKNIRINDMENAYKRYIERTKNSLEGYINDLVKKTEENPFYSNFFSDYKGMSRSRKLHRIAEFTDALTLHGIFTATQISQHLGLYCVDAVKNCLIGNGSSETSQLENGTSNQLTLQDAKKYSQQCVSTQMAMQAAIREEIKTIRKDQVTTKKMMDVVQSNFDLADKFVQKQIKVSNLLMEEKASENPFLSFFGLSNTTICHSEKIKAILDR